MHQYYQTLSFFEANIFLLVYISIHITVPSEKVLVSYWMQWVQNLQIANRLQRVYSFSDSYVRRRSVLSHPLYLISSLFQCFLLLLSLLCYYSDRRPYHIISCSLRVSSRRRTRPIKRCSTRISSYNKAAATSRYRYIRQINEIDSSCCTTNTDNISSYGNVSSEILTTTIVVVHSYQYLANGSEFDETRHYAKQANEFVQKKHIELISFIEKLVVR